MEKTEEDVLEETLRMLYRDHGSRPTRIRHEDGLAVFNWLVTKAYLGRDPHQSEISNIQRSQISSIREEWHTEKLRRLQQSRQCHSRDNPRTNYKKDRPIIIVKREGKTYLIDGSTRINMWFNNGNTELHRVNIHKIVEAP